MSLLQNSNAISTGGAYNLESSLRFRSSASAYLTRTFASASNRKTWTWSSWIKRGKFDSLSHNLFRSNQASSTGIRFGGTSAGDTSNDTLRIFFANAGSGDLQTTQVFRDPSAWYHIVLTVDTTQTTASNRVKLYINGIQVTSFTTATYPSQNYDTEINNNVEHIIGSYLSGGSPIESFDGYQTEINFVDGQALTPSEFGETDTITGVWKPKEYTGTYGTNGFYLPMKETQQATGFNTVLYTGNGGTQSISNVGFSPDLVWMKRRTIDSHDLQDSVRGIGKSLQTESTAAEQNNAGSFGINSFDANGFSLVGNGGRTNESGGSYVAWCWDAGSSTVSNTDGTITSSVRANPATGFSIVTYTGNGSSGTVGHGLGSAPEMIIIKNRSQADGWYVWHQNNGAGIYGYLFLNSTDQVRSSTPQFGTTAPDSSVISLTYNTNDWANASGENYVAYCFSEVAGFSKFGSYTGNGLASGPTVTTGFRPAFVMIKRTDVADNWHIADNTRSPDGTFNDVLRANLSNAESANNTAFNITYNDTGFTLANTNSELNASGGTYIYMAFADTRDAQFNFDASGNKNNWTANNINSNASSETTYDIMNDVATLTDEDTGNFCTLNPNDNSGGTISNGNLTQTNTGACNTNGTIGLPSTGKFYWEMQCVTASGGVIGIGASSAEAGTALSNLTKIYGYSPNGLKYINATSYSYGATYTSGDVIGIAYDCDTRQLTFYKNNVSQGVAFTVDSGYTYLPQFHLNAMTVNVNFGQRPFKYTPPTGYKKLNTYNLPDSTIKDGSQYMDVTTYSGNATTQSITTEFSPDLVWIKRRNSASEHAIFDTVRGRTYSLGSNSTNAEYTTIGADKDLISFDSTGYTVGQANQRNVNSSGDTFVGWSWRGSDSTAVSNTDGTITSTVSANTTSGFSIVTYTGNGGNATIGHGLGVAPKIVIVKNRTTGGTVWVFFTTIVDGSMDYLFLNTTASKADAGESVPTSTTFNVASGSSNINASGNNYVAYCFAEVEGFSKFGSYTGNGSSDGTFVYFGFRPKYIMIKRTDSTGDWIVLDSARYLNNPNGTWLYPNLSNAEGVLNDIGDILSNGYKNRNTQSVVNASGGTYIYMAFAENPFKQSLAR